MNSLRAEIWWWTETNVLFISRRFVGSQELYLSPTSKQRNTANTEKGQKEALKHLLSVCVIASPASHGVIEQKCSCPRVARLMWAAHKPFCFVYSPVWWKIIPALNVRFQQPRAGAGGSSGDYFTFCTYRVSSEWLFPRSLPCNLSPRLSSCHLPCFLSSTWAPPSCSHVTAPAGGPSSKKSLSFCPLSLPSEACRSLPPLITPV